MTSMMSSSTSLAISALDMDLCSIGFFCFELDDRIQEYAESAGSGEYSNSAAIEALPI